MSYDLEIFNGDPEAAEDTFAELDCRLAWHVLEELLAEEHVERDHDELVWFLPTRTVDILIGNEKETMQSLGISMVWGDRSDASGEPMPLPNSSPEVSRQQRVDLTKIFIALHAVADKLGAQLYDPQKGEFLPQEEMEQLVTALDKDPRARRLMDYGEEEEFSLVTYDEEEEVTPASAFSFSPWLVLGVLCVLGFIGMKTLDSPEQSAAVEPMIELPSEPAMHTQANTRIFAELTVENNDTVHRGVLKNAEGVEALDWVVMSGSEKILQRPADKEMVLHLDGMQPGRTYNVYLQAIVDGQPQTVSDVVNLIRPGELPAQPEQKEQPNPQAQS